MIECFKRGCQIIKARYYERMLIRKMEVNLYIFEERHTASWGRDMKCLPLIAVWSQRNDSNSNQKDKALRLFDVCQKARIISDNYLFLLRVLVLSNSPRVNEYEMELSRLNGYSRRKQGTYGSPRVVRFVPDEDCSNVETAVVFFKKRFQLIDETREEQFRESIK